MLKLTYDEYVERFGTERLAKMGGKDEIESVMCSESGTVIIVFGKDVYL